MLLRLAAPAFTVLALGFAAEAGSPRLDARAHWLGNTYPGAERWAQQDIRTIFVTPDGTVYTNVEWDEGGCQVGVYRDGKQVARAGHTHGWGQLGGESVAVNEKYVFIGMTMHNEGGGLRDPATWPPPGTTWFGVSRRLRSDITRPAPFPGGKGGKGDTLKECFLPVVAVPDKQKAHITGLAADDRRLYISDPHAGRIGIHDAETMAPIAAWPVERPGRLALDRRGRLWVLQAGDGANPHRLLGFNERGERLPSSIDFPAEVVPVALAVDDRDRLLVADAGPGQQIRIYDAAGSNPKPVGTFGAKRGIFSGTPGEFGPLRFNNPTGVGTDAKGNLYVASDGQSGGGGTVLESYQPDGTLNWRLLGLEFVDLADSDPAAERDVFTKEEHFRVDPNLPRGRDWTYQGYTLDRFRYPEDPRLHIWSAGAWVRRIEGSRFLFVTEMNAGPLQVYRFDSRQAGEIAIPSGLFAPRRLRDEKDDRWPAHQPGRGEWLWTDKNGNGRFDADEYTSTGDKDAPPAQGWWVDERGTVWHATETEGIRMIPSRGLDAQGNPTWDLARLKTFPMPPLFRQLKRLRHDPGKDVMILGGTTDEHANQHWKPMGPVLARYEHWSSGTSEPRWTVVAPYERGSQGHSSCEPMGFDWAGNYLFVPYTGASKELGFRTGHIEVFRADTGQAVGHIEPPEDVGEIGLQDIRECLTARKLSDGTYRLFLEDDYKAKVLMIHWKP